jgi:hypothetical protein
MKDLWRNTYSISLGLSLQGIQTFRRAHKLQSNNSSYISYLCGPNDIRPVLFSDSLSLFLAWLNDCQMGNT